MSNSVTTSFKETLGVTRAAAKASLDAGQISEEIFARMIDGSVSRQDLNKARSVHQHAWHRLAEVIPTGGDGVDFKIPGARAAVTYYEAAEQLLHALERQVEAQGPWRSVLATIADFSNDLARLKSRR